MGTIHRKAGTHDRHENVWRIGTAKRIAAQIRLYPCVHRYGSQRANAPREGNAHKNDSPAQADVDGALVTQDKACRTGWRPQTLKLQYGFLDHRKLRLDRRN